MITRYLSILTLVLGFSISSYHLRAQKSDYIYEQFTIRDGLPSNECHDILQDSKGYIWIATDNGVAKYDGYQFQNYGPKDGLIDPVIFQLTEDEQGQIWAGGLTGTLFIYTHEDDEWMPYHHQHLVDSLLAAPNHMPEFFVADGKLRFCALHLGYCEISDSGNVAIDTFSINNAHYIIKTDAGILSSLKTEKQVFPTSLNVIDKTTKSPIRTFDLPVYKYIARHTRINKNSAAIIGKHFVVSTSDILLKIDSLQYKILQPQLVTNKICQSKDGSMVLCGTSSTGVTKYTKLNSTPHETILAGVSATDFLEDHQGGIWITTEEQGTFHIGNPHITFLSTSHQDQPYTDIEVLDSITIATASNHGWLDIYNQSTNSIEYTRHDLDAFEFVKMDPDKQKLYTGNNNALRQHSISNGRTISKLLDDNINPIDILFSKDSMTAVTTNGYIYEFNWSAEKEQLSVKGPRMETYMRLNCITTHDGDAYIAGLDGLRIFNKQKELLPFDSFPLLATRIDHILSLGDTTLLLGSKTEGLIVLHNNQAPYALSTEDGLLDAQVNGICTGRSGEIWIATLKGVSQLTLLANQTFVIRNYTVAQGLPSPDIYDLEWSDGVLYAATGRGIAVMDQYPQKTDLSPPSITSFQINNSEYPFQEMGSYPHHQNDIKIESKKIDFNSKNKLKYRYSINDISPIYSTTPSAQFSNLSPGEYSIKIQSEVENDLWSDSVQVKFKIKQVWWRSAWVWILAAILAGAFLLKHFKKREADIYKQNKVKEEIRTLEKAALSSQMNPHFIFNCLNSIQNFIINNDRLAAMDYLSRFAKLIRLTLNASAESSITLQDEIQILTHYLGLEKLRFKDKFDFVIDREETLNPHLIKLPPMLIQPLVENAIKHGMKNVTSGGKIHIAFAQHPQGIKVTVKDNGPNYAASQFGAIKKGTHKSMGLKITNARLTSTDDLTISRIGEHTIVEVLIRN